MNLGDQLRGVLNEEAERRTAAPPDVQGLISGGRTRDEGSVGIITNQPTPQSLPDSAEGVAIEAGTYLVPGGRGDVVAPYTVTVPAGWEAQHGAAVGKQGDQQRTITIEPFVLDQIRLTKDACTGPETLGREQTSVAGLVAGLRAQDSGPRVSDPVATTVGGRPASRIDLDYPASEPLPNCRLSTTHDVEPGALQVWSGYFVIFPAESASVYVVDVRGRAQVLVTRTRDDASAADRAELQSVVDSISFQTGVQ